MESFGDLNSGSFTPVESSEVDSDMKVEGDNVTFNDLDNAEKSRKEYKKAKDAESKKVQQQPTDDPVESQEVKKEQKPRAEKNKHDDKKADEAQGEAEQVAKEIKKLKAKFNDEELEVPADALLTAKIKGEEVPVSVQDLINNFSGKTQWDRKFSDLNNQRMEFKSKQDAFNQFVEKANSENPVEAINLALDMANIDSHNFYKKLKEYIIPDAEEYFNMSDEERKIVDIERENEFLRQKNESYLTNQRQQAETQKLATEINQLRETHGLNEQDIKYAYDALVGNGADKISPQMIAEFAVSYRDGVRVENLLSSISPDLAQDDRVFNAVCDIAKSNPDLSNEELALTVKNVFGVGKDKKKVQSRVESTQKKKEQSTVQPAPTGNLETFDDFDY